MKIVQIPDDKIAMMTECAKEMVHSGRKLMSCLEELEGSKYGERSYSRYGNREWDDEDDDYSRYGSRVRMRDRYGRYM